MLYSSVPTVWISMEKRNESMEIYLCFQTIAPILFSEMIVSKK